MRKVMRRDGPRHLMAMKIGEDGGLYVTIVEQEIFAIGHFCDFWPQAIRVQEIFANFYNE